MITINECVIARDAKYLYLKAAVDDMSYFNDVYVDYLEFTIYKVADKTIEPVKIELNPDGTPHSQPYTENVKKVNLSLEPQDLGITEFRTPVIIVKVYTKGYPSPDTPCGMDEEFAIGIAYNESVLYDKGLGFLRQVGVDCEIPQDFIDWILQSSAFELALKSGNIDEALQWWLRLISNRGTGHSSKSSNCGCHG